MQWIETHAVTSGFSSSYLVYFISLNWDAIILLLFVIFVRWNRSDSPSTHNSLVDSKSLSVKSYLAGNMSLNSLPQSTVNSSACETPASVKRVFARNLPVDPFQRSSTPSSFSKEYPPCSSSPVSFRTLMAPAAQAESPILQSPHRKAECDDSQFTNVALEKDAEEHGYGTTVLLGSVLKRAASYCEFAGIQSKELGSAIRSGCEGIIEEREILAARGEPCDQEDIVSTLTRRQSVRSKRIKIYPNKYSSDTAVLYMEGESSGVTPSSPKHFRKPVAPMPPISSDSFVMDIENFAALSNPPKKWQPSSGSSRRMTASCSELEKLGVDDIDEDMQDIIVDYATERNYACDSSQLDSEVPSPKLKKKNPGSASSTADDLYITLSDHVYIIACHNSSDRIRKTIRYILLHAEPWQIFIADNGSTPDEVVQTRKVCAECSIEYVEKHPLYGGGNVNFGTISEGSKTIAQFATAFNIYRNCYLFQDDIHNCVRESSDANAYCPCIYKPKYVTLLDDDTILPLNWNEQAISKEFEADIKTKCMAYSLRASNRSLFLPSMEDLEYLLAGYMKLAQAKVFGTTLFAPGACNTWKLDYIVDVLLRHDTMHHGDDLQQGLLLHSFTGKRWFVRPIDGDYGIKSIPIVPRDTAPEMGSSGIQTIQVQTEEIQQNYEYVHTGGYAIKVSHDIVVPTDVPRCWIHMRDVLPAGCCSFKWLSTPCKCGEPSLFLQRAKGWDVSRQRFFWKYLKAIFFVKRKQDLDPPAKRVQWTSVWAKLIAFHDLILIINDWVSIIYGLLFLAIADSKWIFLYSIFVTWAFQLSVFTLFNLTVLRPAHLSVLAEVNALFPLLYKLPTILFIRLFGMLYNLLYYYPFVRTKTKVVKLIRRNDGFKSMVEHVWEVDTSYIARKGPNKDKKMGSNMVIDVKSRDSSFTSASTSSSPSSNSSIIPPIPSLRP